MYVKFGSVFYFFFFIILVQAFLCRHGAFRQATFCGSPIKPVTRVLEAQTRASALFRFFFFPGKRNHDIAGSREKSRGNQQREWTHVGHGVVGHRTTVAQQKTFLWQMVRGEMVAGAHQLAQHLSSHSKQGKASHSDVRATPTCNTQTADKTSCNTHIPVKIVLIVLRVRRPNVQTKCPLISQRPCSFTDSSAIEPLQQAA